MDVECPKCGQRISGDDINVAKDLTFCRACNEAFSLSEAVAIGELDDVDFSNPPKGVWIASFGCLQRGGFAQTWPWGLTRCVRSRTLSSTISFNAP